MARPVEIKTPFPSVFETAKRLGVSKRDTLVLSEMAEHSQKSGEFAIPGLGRLVPVERKARTGRNATTGEAVKIPAKKTANFRGSKTTKDAIVPPKK